MNRRQVIAGAALLLSVLGTGCSMVNEYRVSREETHATPHVPGGAVDVRTRNGSVTIVADPSLAEVQITAKITCAGDSREIARQRLAETSLEISRATDRTLHVRPLFSGGPRGGDGATISMRLPDADGVVIDTSNGQVTIEALAGDLEVDTSNGAVRVVDHAGEVSISTSNGGIHLERNEGAADVQTSNGSIEIVEHAGAVGVRTSNGAVSLSLQPDEPGPLKVRTSNGSVRVTVGPGFHGEVNLSTSNSRVTLSDEAGRIRTTDVSKSGGRIVVGEGGESSRITTSNGRINFTIRP